MPKTTQNDRATDLKREIKEIEETLVCLENSTPTVKGVEVQYTKSLPLYKRLKAEIASESNRDEALGVAEKLRDELPQLRAELAGLERQSEKERYQAEYEALQPEINALIDEINGRATELEGLLERLTALDRQASIAYSKANPKRVQSWDTRLANFRKFLPKIERSRTVPGYCLLSRLR